MIEFLFSSPFISIYLPKRMSFIFYLFSLYFSPAFFAFFIGLTSGQSKTATAVLPWRNDSFFCYLLFISLLIFTESLFFFDIFQGDFIVFSSHLRTFLTELLDSLFKRHILFFFRFCHFFQKLR